MTIIAEDYATNTQTLELTLGITAEATDEVEEVEQTTATATTNTPTQLPETGASGRTLPTIDMILTTLLNWFIIL